MKKVILISAMLFLSVFITSCENNIFSPLHSENTGDFDECLSRGEAAYRSSNFSEAKTWFERAVNINPNNSDARYGLARASMRSHNLDIISLAKKMIGKGEGDDIMEELDKDDILSIYDGTSGAQAHTKHIANGLCTSGKIRQEDMYWDHTFITTLKAVSTIFKTMNEIEGILGGDFDIIITSNGVNVSGWGNLSETKQQEIIDDVAELVYDIKDIVILLGLSEEEEGDLLALLDNLGNIN